MFMSYLWLISIGAI